ncbi:MAG: leucyl aminopeptidase [Filifactoraceae bacterium]
MKITVENKSVLNAEATIIPIFCDGELKNSCCQSKNDLIEGYIKTKVFKGEVGEIYSFVKIDNDVVEHIILVGFGNKDKINAQDSFESIAKAVQEAQTLKVKTAKLHLENLGSLVYDEILSRIIIGAGLAEYKYEVFKTVGSKTTDIDMLEIITPNESARNILSEAEIIIESTIIARNLVNMPANLLKPNKLAELAEMYGKEFGFEVSVLGKKEIEELNMEAFLAVAQGSDSEPKLIVMKYSGGSKDTLGIVGKGLTYDTGGYSLKPTDSMDTMKTDMGGSAAAIGAMCAIAKNKLPINVVGVVAACENMVSGHAILPGDVVGSMCGKTIEVHNTDAEGRLTLIDAVYYAVVKEKCDKIVDLATLTGAVVIALGDHYAGILGNDEAMLEEIKAAAAKSGDAVWPMPYNTAIAKRNKSQIADLINSPKRGLGCSVAGAFVGEGVEGKPWVHIDIAGVADYNDGRSYCRNGGSGFGVNLMYQFAKNMKQD